MREILHFKEYQLTWKWSLDKPNWPIPKTSRVWRLLWANRFQRLDKSSLPCDLRKNVIEKRKRDLPMNQRISVAKRSTRPQSVTFCTVYGCVPTTIIQMC